METKVNHWNQRKPMEINENQWKSRETPMEIKRNQWKIRETNGKYGKPPKINGITGNQ